MHTVNVCTLFSVSCIYMYICPIAVWAETNEVWLVCAVKWSRIYIVHFRGICCAVGGVLTVLSPCYMYRLAASVGIVLSNTGVDTLHLSIFRCPPSAWKSLAYHVVLKPLVSLFGCLVACSTRLACGQTDRHTECQTKYCNPRYTCAPRVTLFHSTQFWHYIH